MKDDNKKLTLKTINKSNVWDIQENDVTRLLKSALKDAEAKEKITHLLGIVRSAFEVENIHKELKAEEKKSYEKRGYKLCEMSNDEDNVYIIAIKKKPIVRVTDLSYENIRHISARKLLEVIERNFGGGWDSLSQSIRDIIQSGFDIATNTLPKSSSHSGMYKRKVADGFEVLEIPKGTWVETIFAKAKPQAEKIRLTMENNDNNEDLGDDIEDDDDENITENNYKTTFVIDDEDDGVNEMDGPSDEEIADDYNLD